MDSLFDTPREAHTRNGMPANSYEAAEKVNVTRSMELVLRAARLKARATSDELRHEIIRRGFNISPSGCRSRCRELCEMGLMKKVPGAKPHARYLLTSEGALKANELHRAAHAEAA